MEPVRLRTSGGTVPIAPFIGALGFPAVSVPIVNFDNNQHSPNENLRLGTFLRWHRDARRRPHDLSSASSRIGPSSQTGTQRVSWSCRTRRDQTKSSTMPTAMSPVDKPTHSPTTPQSAGKQRT